MKKSLNVLLIACVVLLGWSCNNSLSYTDRLNNEKDAIKKLINENGFEILKDYPANGVFEANQFVVLDNGVYLNVIDSGNGQRAETLKTTIFARLIASYFMTDTTSYSNYGPHSNGTSPVEFKYGYSTYIYSPAMSERDYSFAATFLSEGMQSGLEKVGNGAKVKLIVPFKVGSQEAQTLYQPVYYEMLEYKFSN